MGQSRNGLFFGGDLQSATCRCAPWLNPQANQGAREGPTKPDFLARPPTATSRSTGTDSRGRRSRQYRPTRRSRVSSFLRMVGPGVFGKSSRKVAAEVRVQYHSGVAIPPRCVLSITGSTAAAGPSFRTEIAETRDACIRVATRVLSSVVMVLKHASAGVCAFTLLQRQLRRVGAQNSNAFELRDCRASDAPRCHGNRAEWRLFHLAILLTSPLHRAPSDLQRQPGKEHATRVGWHRRLHGNSMLDRPACPSGHDNDATGLVVSPRQFRADGTRIPPAAGARTVFGDCVSVFHNGPRLQTGTKPS